MNESEDEEIDIIGDANPKTLRLPIFQPKLGSQENANGTSEAPAPPSDHRANGPPFEAPAKEDVPQPPQKVGPVLIGRHAVGGAAEMLPLGRGRQGGPAGRKPSLRSRTHSHQDLHAAPPMNEPVAAAEPASKRLRLDSAAEQRSALPAAAVPQPVQRPDASLARPSSQNKIQRHRMFDSRLDLGKVKPKSPGLGLGGLGGASPTVAGLLSSRPISSQPEQLAPGEALRKFMEENATTVEEAPLIEELPEEGAAAAAARAPSAQELAVDTACAEFGELLPSLSLSRDSITQATEAAQRVAEAGASARAVRMVLDAAGAAPGPPERLPYLYLLDSTIKSELRRAQETQKGDLTAATLGGAASQQQQPGFPRAVGAAIRLLVDLLVGDLKVASKAERVLNIWHRDGLVAAALVEPALEAVKAAQGRGEAATNARGTSVEEDPAEAELMALLRATPLNAMMTITYPMTGGGEFTLEPPPLTFDDWSDASMLGIKVPQSTKAKKPPPPPPSFAAARACPTPAGPPNVSPWRRQWMIESGEYIPPPPGAPLPGAPPAAAAAAALGSGEVQDDLDEFDRGLMRGAVGAAVAPAAAAQAGGPRAQRPDSSGARPNRQGMPPRVPSRGSSQQGEYYDFVDDSFGPPPLPPRSPIRDEYVSHLRNQMNNAHNQQQQQWMGSMGGLVGGHPMGHHAMQAAMVEQSQQAAMVAQQQQQRMLMEQQAVLQQQQQQQLMMRMQMQGGMGQQMPVGVVGGGGGGGMPMAMMGVAAAQMVGSGGLNVNVNSPMGVPQTFINPLQQQQHMMAMAARRQQQQQQQQAAFGRFGVGGGRGGSSGGQGNNKFRGGRQGYGGRGRR